MYKPALNGRRNSWGFEREGSFFNAGESEACTDGSRSASAMRMTRGVVMRSVVAAFPTEAC